MALTRHLIRVDFDAERRPRYRVFVGPPDSPTCLELRGGFDTLLEAHEFLAEFVRSPRHSAERLRTVQRTGKVEFVTDE